MQNHIGPGEIALRLLLTVAAGTLIGINRGEHGRPAGLRTTLLVCLAASISMIQVNLLLPVAGKAPDSYVVMDLMRLPLGILSGMGFIGAGAILRRDNLVTGVTTAATLWFVTVMGLCFGGGQTGLGLITLALGIIVLWPLKCAEAKWGHDRQAILTIVSSAAGPTEMELRELVASAGYDVVSLATSHDSAAEICEMKCQVKWRATREDRHTPSFIAALAHRDSTLKVAWNP